MAGKVEKYINDEIARKGGLLFALIDPVDYKTPKEFSGECKRGRNHPKVQGRSRERIRHC